MQPDESKQSDSKKDIWFPAKTYGWGWGPPCAWQGWVVMVLWIAAVAAGAGFLMPRSPILGFAYLVAMLCIIMAICWIKGEKPRWRWGKDT